MRANRSIFRPFILLEVLIAITIVSAVLIPLLFPQVLMFREEKKFIHRVELDRIANLVYLELLDGLYEKRIPWDRIASGEWLEGTNYFGDLRTSRGLKSIADLEQKLSVRSFFRFQDIHHKDNETPAAYFFGLEILFLPIHEGIYLSSEVKTKIEKEKLHPFPFWVAIERSSNEIDTGVENPEDINQIPEEASEELNDADGESE
jgi:hypothetical protein